MLTINFISIQILSNCNFEKISKFYPPPIWYREWR